MLYINGIYLLLCFPGCDGARGGCTDQSYLLPQEEDPHHWWLFGGERRRQVETDLQRGLDRDEQQGHLRHVWLPWGETCQSATLQVSDSLYTCTHTDNIPFLENCITMRPYTFTQSLKGSRLQAQNSWQEPKCFQKNSLGTMDDLNAQCAVKWFPCA